MRNALLLFASLLSLLSLGQEMRGRVVDVDNVPIAGAYVFWLNTSIATTTDANGTYSLPYLEKKPRRLVAGFIGFKPDTVSIGSQTEYTFVLASESILDDVVLVEKQKSVEISDIPARKIEQINSAELKKAACCDLAGCFETQNSIQPQTTNAITNSRELRLLGINGVYNQVLIEGLPMIEGMSFTYGVSSIPGIAIDQISISKGANSVIQGHESISGQLNVQLSDPEQTPPLLVNGYVNSFGEQQYNVRTVFSKNNWKNLSIVHVVRPAGRVDGNDDNFIDVPLTERFSFTNKWKYGLENEWGWNSEINARWTSENRTGGQMNYVPKNDTGSTSVYGQYVRFQQPELWGKTRYRFNNDHEFSLYYSGYAHFQDSYFGNLEYTGKQWSSNNRFQYKYGYGANNWVSGVSYRYFSTAEDIRLIEDTLRTFAGNYQREEQVVGLFTEHTWNFFENRLSLMAGARLDHHSQFGFRLTPRFFGKYKLNEKTTLRASAGTGWRVANVFSENVQMLASNRNILIQEDLKPEEAFNTGINLTRDFEWSNSGVSGYVTIDYYYTGFQNQIFPDYLTSSTEILVQNFNGSSVSHAGQIDLNLNYKQFEMKLGYNYLDVFRQTETGRQKLPFTPQNRWMSALNYQSVDEKWSMDLNLRYTGKQRLPNTGSNPLPFQRGDYSDAFTTVNFQVTFSIKNLDIYSGCENVFNYKQPNPIISVDDPFSRYFDTSSVWGPIRGREIYLGFRFSLD